MSPQRSQLTPGVREALPPSGWETMSGSRGGKVCHPSKWLSTGAHWRDRHSSQGCRVLVSSAPSPAHGTAGECRHHAHAQVPGSGTEMGPPTASRRFQVALRTEWCAPLCVYSCAHVVMCVHTCLCMGVCACTRLHVCMSVRALVCVCVCACECVCECTRACAILNSDQGWEVGDVTRTG